MRAAARTEAIKLRRSVALWLAVVTPVLVVGLDLIGLLGRRRFSTWGGPAGLWHDLLRDEWTLWAAFAAPVLLSIEAAALIHMESAGQHWKQLFAFPVPRWNYYAAKMLCCAVLMAASYAIFAVGITADLLLVSAFRDLNLGSSIPWTFMLELAGKAYLACWLAIVIQVWISGRVGGYAMPIGAAIVGLVLGLMLQGMNREAFYWWYPWTLPFHTMPPPARDLVVRDTLSPAVFGSVVGVLASVAACWDLGRRREAAPRAREE